MTPRTIESEFSDLLKSQMKEETNFDLTLEGPLLSRQHPKVLWAKLQAENNPEQEINYAPLHGWNFECFKNLAEASQKFPQIELQFRGQPWAVNKFLSSGKSEAIIDFDNLGAVVLSKNELPAGSRHSVTHHVLSTWLSYALSPELWGPVGKWTRFHSRLHELFQKHDLLATEDSPGYYPLKSKAQKLSDFGFQGTNLDKMYLLVLPWTFSLTALEKLEERVQEL
jgi:hypothetical protein